MLNMVVTIDSWYRAFKLCRRIFHLHHSADVCGNIYMLSI